jgi:hypothetical protein
VSSPLGRSERVEDDSRERRGETMEASVLTTPR